MSDTQLEPWHNASNWAQAAIAAAVIVGVLFCFAAVWVIGAPETSIRLQRVQIVSPFGVFGVAVVSFFTIVWRGLITSRQAELQAEQIAGLKRQITSTDENNLAKLFQDGAKLMADNKPESTLAGIASLGAVAVTENEQFSTIARIMLINFVQEVGQYDHHGTNVTLAIELLRRAYLVRPETVVDKVAFSASDYGTIPSRDSGTDWLLVWGCDKCVYTGGKFHAQIINLKDKIFNFSNVYFAECKFDKNPLGISGSTFFRCEFSSENDDEFYVSSLLLGDSAKNSFQDCIFGKVPSSYLAFHWYDHCNFSGAVICIEHDRLPDLRRENCFFYDDDPPRFLGAGAQMIDARTIFNVRPRFGA